jgi:hypothetical protein
MSVRAWLVLVALASLSACGSSPTPSAPTPQPSPVVQPAPTPTPNPSPTPSAACGVERWAVKTLTDPDATRVDFANVIPTTVAALNAFPTHCSDLPDNRTFPEEFRVYETTAIVQLTREEEDHDIHVVLADPADSTQTMVVEVVDPACALTSPYLSLLTQARTQYQSLSPLTGKSVRVRGVGFYDFAHGQTGRSRSCIELHPVTNVTVTTPTPAPAPSPAPSPTPTPSPSPSPPPASWSGPLPPRTSGSHPVCQAMLPSTASCVNDIIGTPQAICEDTLYSCTTGSGTCSGHGGVYCWRN